MVHASALDIVMTKHNLWFIWESILGNEESEKKERRRINQVPETTREFGLTKKEAYWLDCTNGLMA
jgi:hypothetical protein